MGKHVTAPDEVDSVITYRDRFDVRLQQGHGAAERPPRLQQAETDEVEADYLAAKALDKWRRVPPVATADIEYPCVGIDTKPGGDVEKRLCGAGRRRRVNDGVDGRCVHAPIAVDAVNGKAYDIVVHHLPIIANAQFHGSCLGAQVSPSPRGVERGQGVRRVGRRGNSFRTTPRAK